MLLFDKYDRADVPKWKTIYLTQEALHGRAFTRYRVRPDQDGMQVLVDAISPEHARAFYEREFFTEVEGLEQR